MTDAPPLYMTGASADEAWPLVRDFHYSQRMPSAIRHCFAWRGPGGLFGDFGTPLAVAIYGNPVNRAWPADALELQRLVRSPDLDRPLSEFVSWSLRWLKANTDTPFVLSYADWGREHHGGIYQATGFSYVYESPPAQDGIINTATGEFIHGRQCNRMFGSRGVETLRSQAGPDWEPAYHKQKYVYVKPIRKRKSALFRQFGWSDLPYPKPANRPEDESASNRCEAGATPAVRSKIEQGALQL